MTSHHAPAGPHGFSDPDRMPGALSAGDAARILGAVGDLALVLDDGGKVLDVAISDAELARYGLADWAGRDWADTVTIESKPKLAEMLDGTSEAGRWRQVNHPTPNGEVPVRYLTLPLGPDQNGKARRIAIGRDMRGAAAAQQRLLQTQQALERDYVRLRQAEARYRMLFDLGHEPVLIVDAATRKIREANLAAHRLLGLKDGALVNQPVTAIADAAARESLIAHLGAAEAVDDAAPVAIRLAKDGGEAHVTARLFRQARVALLLVRIEPPRAEPTAPAGDGRLAEVVERMPDAFVLADADLKILTANHAFVELAQAPSLERVTGAPLGQWLGRPELDLDLILGQIRERGDVRNVATILRGSGGGREEVEVSGVAAGDTYGFTIRDVGRRLRAIPEPGLDLPRSVDQLTELVGRMSLKDIVRESTDLIERLCIEAALAYTDDNRASAAEILGVSRQSLYSKLHRHGLGDLATDAE